MTSDTTVALLGKALAANSEDASFTANAPTTTEPTGAVVPAGGLERGPKPRLKDEEQPM